ncbi:TetR-like C-terminal domain-containing protein [Nocardia thraciensis]
MHAMRVDPELARALEAHVADEDLGPFRTIVLRAVARGELPEGTEPVRAHRVSEAQILHRMLSNGTVDTEFLADLIDELLIPLLTRGFPDKDRRR